MRVRAIAVLALGLGWVRGVRADEPTGPLVPDSPVAADAARRVLEEDPNFGPEITVERIEIRGNSRTAERLIRRALLIKAGDTLRAGDPRFRTSRFRVLALGYFADVQLRLDRGSAHGRVLVTVEVVERGTFILNRIFLGTSDATPVWAGLDAGDGNLLGSGVALSGAVVWAAEADIEGASPQLGVRLRLADQSVLGSPIGLHGSFLYNDASEPYRVAGDVEDGDPDLFRAYDYRRVGGVVGAGFDLTRLSRLTLDLRFEAVHADVPAGVTTALEPGDSRVATIAVGFERDTRSDPVLPYAGDRLIVVAEGAGQPYGSSYDFLRLQARYARWFPLGGVSHVLSLHAGAGLILGDAPLFDAFYVGDWNRLITPRALDLVLSTHPSRNFLDTDINAAPYGNAAGMLEVEYSYRLFRRRKFVYGGDLFVGTGLFALGRRDDLAELPVDLTFDVGMRLDTEIGIFELSFANALGRIPL